ncbi:serine/threonine-protein kinase STE20-like [Portunus trituberculatus]|uniref:Serine/threonine-protein kinase STE20 n=1 Tax=Portunus trituberculatus TaxID=210409 RepID=A0A5B7I7E6_PORTR|nr:serine/threonine-protein kinase STE20-like [Portunus trituberculatus]MPC77417.1 Serine/threonine-protein kinase STE20 [Portunus trituberculatus]
MKPAILSQDDLKEMLKHPYRSLGKGAQGAVYLVKYRGADCCLKLASRQQDPERFLYEGEVLRKMKGAGGAPRLLAATEDEGRRLGLLITFCGDDTFMQLSRVARTDQEMLHAFIQLCRGVHKVHARGYVHNDIKANNVVVRRDAHDGRVHVSLIDYGLAQRKGVPLLSHVRTYNRLAWMAPEVYQCAPCRPSMDVYSLGHLLKEVLAQCKGSYPELQEVAQRAMATLPQHRPSLKALTKILERCLLPSPPSPSPSFQTRLRSFLVTVGKVLCIKKNTSEAFD